MARCGSSHSQSVHSRKRAGRTEHFSGDDARTSGLALAEDATTPAEAGNLALELRQPAAEPVRRSGTASRAQRAGRSRTPRQRSGRPERAAGRDGLHGARPAAGGALAPERTAAAAGVARIDRAASRCRTTDRDHGDRRRRSPRSACRGRDDRILLRRWRRLRGSLGGLRRAPIELAHLRVGLDVLEPVVVHHAEIAAPECFRDG